MSPGLDGGGCFLMFTRTKRGAHAPSSLDFRNYGAEPLERATRIVESVEANRLT